MKKITSIIFFILCVATSTFANDLATLKTEADSAFARENYTEAAKLYEQITKEISHADVFYNLGCTYYRLDDMAHAVLNFERAFLLDPGNENIRFNLNMARSKTVDRITPRHEIFFVTLYRNITNAFNLQQWATICIALFIVSLIALGLFLLSNNYNIRKYSFYCMLSFFLLTIFCNLCAYNQRQFVENRTSAIIMSTSVTVKSTPSESGNELFVLHEGTRVEITDNEMKEWCEIQIADGKVGWIPRSVIEII